MNPSAPTLRAKALVRAPRLRGGRDVLGGYERGLASLDHVRRSRCAADSVRAEHEPELEGQVPPPPGAPHDQLDSALMHSDTMRLLSLSV